MGRHTKRYTDRQLARRERVESELSSIPVIHPTARKLISTEGFIEYFLEMRDLYQSYVDAYELLEEFYITVTGQRRYSEYDSFKKAFQRYMRNTAR